MKITVARIFVRVETPDDVDPSRVLARVRLYAEHGTLRDGLADALDPEWSVRRVTAD